MTLGTAAAGSVKAGGGTYNIGFNDGDETQFDAYDLAELFGLLGGVLCGKWISDKQCRLCGKGV